MDGRLVGMASEERFTRVKNQGGFPNNTIRWLLDKFSPPKIDFVSLAGKFPPIASPDYYRHGRHRIYDALAGGIPSAFQRSHVFRSIINGCCARTIRQRIATTAAALGNFGISAPIAAYDHHTCHALAALHTDPSYTPEERAIIISIDGSGDLLSGGVWETQKHQLRQLAAFSSFDSLGILYSRTTLLMGMKPHEHEYKIMGLAPYASAALAQRSASVFRSYFTLRDGLFPVNRSGAWGGRMVKRLHRDLFLHRFDSIAAGLQTVFEELYVNLIANWRDHTGVSHVIVTGGCAMNVKANMLLAERLGGKASVFVMPSGGDESIALGAAMAGIPSGDISTRPAMAHLYTGPSYTDEQCFAALNAFPGRLRWDRPERLEVTAAQMLAEGKIIARCVGNMEWGARALGNRSILADPSRIDTVTRINRVIKQRDFWMPFAPSVLSERASDYFLPLPALSATPYMTTGFRSTDLARKHLVAALHQADHTGRPQFVSEHANPPYYALIKEFERVTGIGAVLNTSFNLHGKPIVNTPTDALETLLNSDLDGLMLGPYIVTRRD